MSRLSAALRLAVGALVVLCCTSAHADLLGDADKLLGSWRASGAQAKRVVTLFLQRGEARSVRLAKDEDPKTLGAKSKRCATVVAMTHRSLSFTVALPTMNGKAGVPHKSVAGVVQLTRCSTTGPGIPRVTISLASKRGAIEVIVANRVGAMLPKVSVVLPERAVGAVAGRGRSGKKFRPAPRKERVSRAREAALADGAKAVISIPTRASSKGEGALALKLRGGCHRLTLHAESKGKVDVDAEVRLRRAKTPLRKDESHAPDARLDFCIGKTAPVELHWGGAGRSAPMTILAAYWPFKATIAASWGATAQAGIAWALHKRKAPRLIGAPIKRVVGGHGTTSVPIIIEPGACYVAAFSGTRGAITAGRIGVFVDGRRHHDDAVDEIKAGAVTFCSRRDTRALLEIDLRGETAWWIAMVWRVGT